MKKADLIEAIAGDTGESAALVARMLTSLVEITTARLKKGEEVTITGFCSFKPSKRAARAGRNPSTGEAIKIAAANVVRISAGATLKAAVNTKGKAKK